MKNINSFAVCRCSVLFGLFIFKLCFFFGSLSPRFISFVSVCMAFELVVLLFSWVVIAHCFVSKTNFVSSICNVRFYALVFCVAFFQMSRACMFIVRHFFFAPLLKLKRAVVTACEKRVVVVFFFFCFIVVVFLFCMWLPFAKFVAYI